HEISLRRNLHHVFVDFKQVYDTVLVSRVLATLAQRGASTGNGSKIVVNGELTPVIPKARGLFQGSILSPVLSRTFLWGAEKIPIVPSYTYLRYTHQLEGVILIIDCPCFTWLIE
ncbi:hypothetical protein L0F63_005842, partial [Massospora cicadina]